MSRIKFLCATQRLGEKAIFQGALQIQLGFKDRAFAADGYLFIPAFLYIAVVDGSVDKPAEMTGVEFPGRTILLYFIGTLADVPAGLFDFVIFLEQQEKQLCPVKFRIISTGYEDQSQQVCNLFL